MDNKCRARATGSACCAGRAWQARAAGGVTFCLEVLTTRFHLILDKHARVLPTLALCTQRGRQAASSSADLASPHCAASALGVPSALLPPVCIRPASTHVACLPSLYPHASLSLNEAGRFGRRWESAVLWEEVAQRFRSADKTMRHLPGILGLCRENLMLAYTP